MPADCDRLMSSRQKGLFVFVAERDVDRVILVTRDGGMKITKECILSPFLSLHLHLVQDMAFAGLDLE